MRQYCPICDYKHLLIPELEEKINFESENMISFEIIIQVSGLEAEKFIEALPDRVIGILFAVVPLAEAPGHVTGILKILGNGFFTGPHYFVPVGNP